MGRRRKDEGEKEGKRKGQKDRRTEGQKDRMTEEKRKTHMQAQSSHPNTLSSAASRRVRSHENRHWRKNACQVSQGACARHASRVRSART